MSYAAGVSSAPASITWPPASPTPIFTRRGFSWTGFGTRTVSTPLSNAAVTASGSMPSGRLSERANEPVARSTR